MKPYSVSRIELWDKCKYVFKRHYVDGVPTGTNNVMLGGRLSHFLNAKYTGHLINTEQPSDIEMIPKIAKDTKEPIPFAIIDEYTKLFKQWAETFQLQNFIDVSVERRLALDINYNPVIVNTDEFWNSKKVFVRGIIDFLDIGEGKIVDYKTNHTIPPKREMESSLQTRLYPLLVSKNFDIDYEITVVYDFVRYGHKMEFIVKPEQYMSVEDWLKNKAEEIESEVDFKPTICSYCEYCSVKNECPAIKKALNNDEILFPENQEGAVNLSNTLLGLQERAKEIVSILKEYVDVHGSVNTGDIEYRQNISESYEINDCKALVNLLKTRGVEDQFIWQILSASKKNIESVLKKAKVRELIEVVKEELAENTVKTRYGFYKVKKE